MASTLYAYYALLCLIQGLPALAVLVDRLVVLNKCVLFRLKLRQDKALVKAGMCK